MVDTSHKLEKIVQLIEEGEYFTINRPRQFGKTTTLSLLTDRLKAREEYLVFTISLEGVGDAPFADEQAFCPALLRFIARSVMFSEPELADYFTRESQQLHSFEDLSLWISRYVQAARKHVVLMIDEVDKSSNNQIFLHFLGMLRDKYLLRNKGQDYTFQSVILAGVHDIKTLKLKIRPEQEKPPFDAAQDRYNSPWNIAIDFEVDLSFDPQEIATMLHVYGGEKQIDMDIPAIASNIFYYTSGYPYLVSKLCKFIDEKIVPSRTDANWTVDDVEAAFQMITNEGYTTTLFDSLGKNLENNPDLYETVFQIVINGQRVKFSIIDPVINLGHLYGILSQSAEGWCNIHNRIFEQRIYGYMMSKTLRTHYGGINGFGGPEYYTDEGLDVPLILQRFQTFMKEHYSHKDEKFLEREGRLLFLAFLRPILNGKGFDFKEPNVADERRMDLVITYRNHRYVIELKRWYGPKAHQEGLQQLSDYLDTYSLKQGYLLIYDFNKNKEYKQEQSTFNEKQIFAVWV
jgi:hypothetical protein